MSNLRSLCLLTATLFCTLPAHAVIKGQPVQEAEGVRASVVRVESNQGELCSGVLIAPDVVLTAAHCVAEKARYRVTGVKPNRRILTVNAASAAVHPDFVPGTTPRNQPGVDLALLLLESPLDDGFTALSPSYTSFSEGETVTLAGFGVSVENAKSTARTLRQVQLLAVGSLQVANKVQVIVDPVRLGEIAGAGACRGDSGGPVLRGASGQFQLVGIVSWSSGPLNAQTRNACGGLTAVTPIAPHATWISRRTQSLRDANQNAGTPAALLGGQYDWTVR